jgi:protein-disulfide isomerase
MSFSRLLVPLVILTLLMQGAILYKQHGNSTTTRERVDSIQEAPTNSVVDISGAPVKGADSARIVLVEFSDYECPFCQRHAISVGPLIDQAFISAGKMRVAFLNNPLPMHANAKLLATAAICAGKQDRYWEMHDSLFRLKPTDKEALIRIATELRLNVLGFQDCLEDNPNAAATIQHDIQIAKTFDLGVTPAFGIGFTDESGRVQIRKFIRGAVPFEAFQKAIDEMLLKQSKL